MFLVKCAKSIYHHNQFTRSVRSIALPYNGLPILFLRLIQELWQVCLNRHFYDLDALIHCPLVEDVPVLELTWIALLFVSLSALASLFRVWLLSLPISDTRRAFSQFGALQAELRQRYLLIKLLIVLKIQNLAAWSIALIFKRIPAPQLAFFQLFNQAPLSIWCISSSIVLALNFFPCLLRMRHWWCELHFLFVLLRMLW